jgi:hypothetical protein
MTPIERAIDELNRRMFDHHAWLSDASEKVRKWKAEDQANGIPWDTREEMKG